MATIFAAVISPIPPQDDFADIGIANRTRAHARAEPLSLHRFHGLQRRSCWSEASVAVGRRGFRSDGRNRSRRPASAGLVGHRCAGAPTQVAGRHALSSVGLAILKRRWCVWLRDTEAADRAPAPSRLLQRADLRSSRLEGLRAATGLSCATQGAPGRCRLGGPSARGSRTCEEGGGPECRGITGTAEYRSGEGTPRCTTSAPRASVAEGSRRSAMVTYKRPVTCTVAKSTR
jgi:hypothetical protein